MGESSENKKKSLNHLDFILFARMDKADCLKFPEGFEENVPFLPFSRHLQNTGFIQISIFRKCLIFLLRNIIHCNINLMH